MNNQKRWYKSKELWMAVFPVVNIILRSLDLPSIELTEGFYAGWIALIGATRLFFTKTKLTIFS